MSDFIVCIGKNTNSPVLIRKSLINTVLTNSKNETQIELSNGEGFFVKESVAEIYSVLCNLPGYGPQMESEK